MAALTTLIRLTWYLTEHCLPITELLSEWWRSESTRQEVRRTYFYTAGYQKNNCRQLYLKYLDLLNQVPSSSSPLSRFNTHSCWKMTGDTSLSMLQQRIQLPIFVQSITPQRGLSTWQLHTMGELQRMMTPSSSSSLLLKQTARRNVSRRVRFEENLSSVVTRVLLNDSIQNLTTI